MQSIEERFEAKVDRSGEHHRWLGATEADGTPQIRVNGQLTTARRVAWERAYGPLAPGVTVAACEHDKTCVRVEHLALGRRRRVASIAAAAPGGRIATVEALAEAYFSHLESAGRSAGTLRRYRQLWRQWLAPDLAQIEPAVLTRARIERTLGDMADAGQSRSSIHQAAVVLSCCLAWAEREGQLRSNPACGLRLADGTHLAPPRRR